MTGTIVDCPKDNTWDLRIVTDGLLVIDAKGTIVFRGEVNDLTEKIKEKFDVTKVIELQNKNEFLLPG